MVEYVAYGINSKELKQRQQQRQQEREKKRSTVVGLINKTTTSHVHHAILCIFLPSTGISDSG